MVEGRRKPGRKGRQGGGDVPPPNEHAAEYERWGLPQGKTVAEWEAIMGLEPYTLYPWAQNAKSFDERGYFMYRNATDDERHVMEKARGRHGQRAMRKEIEVRKKEVQKEARAKKRYQFFKRSKEWDKKGD